MAIIPRKNTALQTLLQPASFELATNVAHSVHTLVTQAQEHRHQERLHQQEVERSMALEREKTQRFAQAMESQRELARSCAQLACQSPDAQIRQEAAQEVLQQARGLSQILKQSNWS